MVKTKSLSVAKGVRIIQSHDGRYFTKINKPLYSLPILRVPKGGMQKQLENLFSDENLLAQRRVQVLVPYPVARAYDYSLPSGMDVVAGDYVRVTLGKRDTIGVVWGLEADAQVNAAKVKPILQKFSCPPMPETQRRFIDWVARYTMSDAGSVLKMALSVPEALQEQKTVPAYTLPDGAVLDVKKASIHRKKIAEFLADGVPRRAADIARETGCSAAVIRAMAQAGQLQTISASSPPPCTMIDVSSTRLQLTAAQEEAAEGLRSLVDKQGFSPVLLDGVTGSGKTEVYFEAVAEALRQGKQVLILLPEISLSAQFLDRFQRRFGVAPALWHSEVSPAQKRVTWMGVAEGRTRVVVGARSALFLPYARLGLIIADEEHDASYKQEEGVLYHARDMAVVRARMEDIPVVLVSATPSLETMTNVYQSKYHYLRLPSRHTGAKLPDVHLLDLKKAPPDRGRFLSPVLLQALQDTLAAQEQALLFLNRRGYAPLTLCRHCGFRFQCPSCTAWLVEHKRLGRLQCHHCGFSRGVPQNCPECGEEESLVACGPGIERIQEEVQNHLPDARTLVLASDLITSPNILREAIRKIEDQEADIIIGTQIVAKGHHFPSLTCVGIVDADLGLSGGDLRAGERTFQLLHQVAGRAGRGDKVGRVYIQTYMPEQKVIQALSTNDRDAFLQAERDEREKAAMPPFGKLAGIIISGANELQTDQFCQQMIKVAPRFDDVRVLGPVPAPMAYLRGKHRRRFLIQTGKAVSIQRFIQEWVMQLRVPSALQLKVDIDPQSFY